MAEEKKLPRFNSLIEIADYIEEEKFNSLKDKPSEYITNFPSIITYNGDELAEKILTFARLRIYRLANIIDRQKSMQRGPYGPNYTTWRKRLKLCK